MSGFFEGFRGPREGFLRVFQNFRGRRRVFLGFFWGFLGAPGRFFKGFWKFPGAAEGFFRVFWSFFCWHSKKKQNSGDPSGSIRDITAHLIHDKNTSIAVPCTVFTVLSAGYDPGWIYWSYEFSFSTPGTLDPEASTDWTQRSKFEVPQVWPHDSM